ncbi:Rv3235 family protein [Saccharomonospora saliphila]|uniref:Rv3235 family protein n=1 Tax=Saccharomonospora saliphila TaxID=369829 RepID=UPI00036F4EB3|nr:Rv3235 family protein [Saccharomonospora saliphila]
MRPFSPASGLLPLRPYEPGEHDPDPDSSPAAQSRPPEVADGQLTLDDLLAELEAERPRPESVPAPSRRLLHRVTTGLLEARTGRRPLAQLDPWLAPVLRRRLRATPPRLDGPRYILRNLHVCRPAEEALELCGTATAQARACAVAARFEHDSGGWVCVAFAVLEPR